MRSTLGLVLALLLAASCLGQEIVLDDGEVLKGSVIKVADNRVQVKTTDGRVLRLEPRRIRFARDAGGDIRRFPARLVTRLMTPEQKNLLTMLGRGDELIEPDLLRLTADCTVDLVVELEKSLAAEDETIRALAGAALALAATPETVKSALKAALEDPSTAVRRAAAGRLVAPVAIAALAEAKLVREIERGLGEKDRVTRYALAHAAVELDSKTAIPVLAKFVRDRDHHIREEAALTLARHGDAAGEKVLVQILKRKESAVVAANRGADPALLERLKAGARRERLEVCELAGRLRLKSARSTLRLLVKGDDEELAARARAALALIED